MSEQNLWAPWRISYVKDGVPDTDSPDTSWEGCFLCDAAEANLTENQHAERLVLLTDDRGVLMLNRFPYTNGHLLVGPPEHVADLGDLSGERQQGLMQLLDLANRLLNEAINPQGVNIGSNIGRCAGAGLPGHLHFHIVPRWHGDVNFMDVVGGSRVIPQALAESYRVLSETLGRMER